MFLADNTQLGRKVETKFLAEALSWTDAKRAERARAREVFYPRTFGRSESLNRTS